ncbi:unnamed protein product [Cyprideis torosa]|uniref:Uncharacterized protein n=1 Tax=Cyprideis torosa TaxID=163714 RepID=A0A7R8WEH0_9CRUS|nr:unnamed protein product [Cyprideis torosa]CAG0889475.1 unnamed protein product [Cyprideis torosa]
MIDLTILSPFQRDAYAAIQCSLGETPSSPGGHKASGVGREIVKRRSISVPQFDSSPVAIRRTSFAQVAGLSPPDPTSTMAALFSCGGGGSFRRKRSSSGTTRRSGVIITSPGSNPLALVSYRGAASHRPSLPEEGSGEASAGASSSGGSEEGARGGAVAMVTSSSSGAGLGIPKSASASYLFPLELGTSPQSEPPMFFEPPELSEETIMEPEHLESVSRLQLVLSLSEIIMDLAAQKGSPFAKVTSVEQQKAEEITLFLKLFPLSLCLGSSLIMRSLERSSYLTVPSIRSPSSLGEIAAYKETCIGPWNSVQNQILDSEGFFDDGLLMLRSRKGASLTSRDSAGVSV